MTNYLGITVVWNDANATPMRKFDWCAYVIGQEENPRLHAYGATKQEALEELGFAIIERVDDRLYDMRDAGEWDAETMEEAFVSIDGLSYLPY